MTMQGFMDGIAASIFKEFGSEYEIYSEKVQQGFAVPCFLIRCLNSSMNCHGGQRYKRESQIVVQYFPSTIEKREECASILERLFACLEYITVDGRLIHGAELNGEMTNEVLTFTVNYDGFVIKRYEEENMKTLSIASEVKSQNE